MPMAAKYRPALSAPGRAAIRSLVLTTHSTSPTLYTTIAPSHTGAVSTLPPRARPAADRSAPSANTGTARRRAR